MCVRGDIYYAVLGQGEGSEQSGYRPVVIIQNNIGNKLSPTVIVATITSTNKSQIPTHVDIVLRKPSVILCEQIRTISKTRLKEKFGKLSEEELQILDEKLKLSLAL